MISVRKTLISVTIILVAVVIWIGIGWIKNPHVVQLSLSNVNRIIINDYLLGNLLNHRNKPLKSVVATSLGEKEIIYQINSSKIEPSLPPGTIIVTPAIGLSSTYYKIIVHLKPENYLRIFTIGPWGPTHDVTYDVNLTPGISRNLLSQLLTEDSKDTIHH